MQQSSYSAMLNIREPVPHPESVSSTPELHKNRIDRNWKEFLGIPELQELIPSRCDSGIPYRNRSFILEVSL